MEYTEHVGYDSDVSVKVRYLSAKSRLEGFCLGISCCGHRSMGALIWALFLACFHVYYKDLTSLELEGLVDMSTQ